MQPFNRCLESNHFVGSPSPSIQRMLTALQEKRFFKLIGGGSLTEVERLAPVAHAYALAGVDCIDIAPDLLVIQAVETTLSSIPLADRPTIMVSLPLDPDPHFRKIDLLEADCIQCGACLPVCPTEAITLPDLLEISQSLCYGCGRCVPTCPTDALSLLPFQVESQIEAALSHPAVEAVEIHSQYVDPYMLKAFLERWDALLKDKLLALCFRIGNISSRQALEFYQVAVNFSPFPVILQIDGAPMSGNDDPEASRPALESAIQVIEWFQTHQVDLPPITISGGINQHTAALLKEERYQETSGVGMGTMARKPLWHAPDLQTATAIAKTVIQPFRSKSQG